MRCSNCAVEAGVQQGPCPNCGIFISAATRESFGKRQPALLIAVSLAAFLAVAGSIGFVAYTLFKSGGILQTVRSRQSRFNSGLRARKSEYPVEHGNVVRPEDMRGHGTLYFVPVGTNHTFNTYLSSDGASALTYISVVHEDGWQDYLNRLTPGRGFSTRVEFESREDGIRGARLTWDSGNFKLRYRDGSWSSFLPCNDGTCYWTGYQDAKGNTLKFERGPQRQLLQVTASDQQGVSFQSDPQLRVTEATATDGKSVAYEYDDQGCLARVRRSDGQETVYSYDAAHRMTSVSVVTAPGGQPEQIISIEYDARGRVVKLALAGMGAYAIEYLAANGRYATDLHVTDPDGQILHLTIDADDYVVHAPAVRFPRVVAHR